MKRLNIIICFLVFSCILFAQQSENYGRGLEFDDEGYLKTPLKAPLVRSLYSDLPDSYSLKKYTPYPKSQGQYGTCVGWSTAYAAFTIIKAKQNGWTDKTTITDNTFSPGFIYGLIKYDDDYGCEFGSSIGDALEMMKVTGAAKYNDLSINCPDDISYDLIDKAYNNRIKDYAKIFDLYDYNETKIEATKKSLSENKPVVIGMMCPESFSWPTGYWEPEEDPYGEYGGHAMCVIGYDDYQYGGAFEIQNSWGEDWGNDGYIWIRYEDYADFTKYAFELIEDQGTSSYDEVDLSGELRFIQSDGTEMNASLVYNYYEMDDSYRSGTKFRIYLSNNEPAFVYAFGSDFTSKTFPIFPHNEYISPALTYSQNDVAIPDEEHYIEMDNTVGTDYLCVLYSKDPLDIDQIMSEVENQYGSFFEKVETTLEPFMVSYENIEYLSNGQIGFNAKSRGQSIVVLIVLTDHIE